ncbi:MAG: hypothetical protein EBR82_29970 [Caulobacteraceae bacterium]|nr:hypothetical protein [Caulobacteraceae bacterium]
MLVPSKEIMVEYPGMPGFEINICFLSRETLQTIRKKATKTTFKNRQPVEELNDDLFLELYVKGSVKGWKGFKMKYLEQLAPVDVSDQDSESELEYTEENALYLMKSSVNFDSFISEQVTDLGNFSKSK